MPSMSQYRMASPPNPKSPPTIMSHLVRVGIYLHHDSGQFRYLPAWERAFAGPR
jgi:hypothetical protein